MPREERVPPVTSRYRNVAFPSGSPKPEAAKALPGRCSRDPAWVPRVDERVVSAQMLLSTKAVAWFEQRGLMPQKSQFAAHSFIEFTAALTANGLHSGSNPRWGHPGKTGGIHIFRI